MKKTTMVPQMIAALCVTIIPLAIGFHFGWSSPELPKLLADTSVPVTVEQSSWIVSLLMVGMSIGPFITVNTVDRWGRKTTLLLVTIPFFLSCVLIAFAQNYWWYYAARLLSGLGVGAVFTTIPIYLGEIVEDKIRGGVSILFSFMMNLGYIIAYGAGPWVSSQILAGIGALIPILHILTFSSMPETPYYHFMKNEPEKARKSLEWLRGTRHVAEEAEKMGERVAFELQNKGTLKELFTDKGNRKALLIIVGLCTGQQLSGITVIMSYSTMIFNEAGTDLSSSISVIITGVVQLVVAFLVVFLADRTGRRTLLLVSMFFSAVFLFGEGVYFQLKSNGEDVSEISWLPVTAIIGMLCSYTLGMGTLPVTLISEMFACNIKTYAITIVVVHLSLVGTIVSQIYPIVVHAYGIHAAFYSFAVCCIVCMVFTFIYTPETKGKSLSQIQDILQGRSESNLKSKSRELPYTVYKH